MGTLRGEKILFIGPTGQIGKPLALALAAENDVWGLARFKDGGARAEMESAGVRCVPHNLATDDFSGLPDDFGYVLNLDRKSTRLNSSHSQISYAVFCL